MNSLAPGTVAEAEVVAILDAAADAMFRLDTAGRVTRCNRSALRILGHGAQELLGRPFRALLLPAGRPAFDALIAQAGQAGRVDDYSRNSLRRSDGQVVPVALTVTPTGGAGWWAVARDLTEQADAQRTLAESEQRVRRGEVLAATGSFVVDGAAGLVQWSTGMYLIFDVVPGASQLSVPAHLDLVHPDDRAEVRSAVQDALAGVRAAELDHRIVRPDGEIGWVFLAVEPAHDAAGAVLGARGVCQDVTARKQADIAVREALERERAASHELRRLDRAKEEFLATVSHELRTPLTAILGFASLLRGTAAEHDQLLEPIERNASDMAQMVERLLDYSRLEAGGVTIEPRSIDLGELIAGSVRQLSASLGGRPVDVVIPTGQQVWADPEALERILVNLIGNAAKYSERPAAIAVAAEPGGQGIIISVADEGPGIDEEHQMRIFERFFRIPGATRAKRGTGVGLAIVRQYVELHGGMVWVDSEPGKGSTFRFDLAIETEAL
jgi:PAS domain S-box-containing protein